MRDPKPPKRVKRREQKLDREAARAFYGIGPCALCNLLGSESHHAVPQQHIRRAGLGERVRWDVRNRMVLCSTCHDDHHSRKRPIRFTELPPSVLEFADEYGFTDYIERMYPNGDL